MAEPLLILGASARAAAFSALAAGLKPWCGDLFADADLARVATVERVEGYPAGLQRAAERAPHGPWLYTGSLENHPRLVEWLAARRPLAGNGATALRAVRDPGRWGGELARHDLPCHPFGRRGLRRPACLPVPTVPAMLSLEVTRGLAVAVLGAMALGLGLWAAACRRRTRYSWPQAPIYLYSTLMSRVVWRGRAAGRLPLPDGQGGVIVANHISGIDPSVIAITSHRPVRWMVAREYCTHWALGWFFRTLGCIPVNRGGIDTAATKLAIRYAQAGDLVGLFPEGRINNTDSLLLPGRPGAALIALKARVPVVPCYVEGTPYAGDSVFSSLFMTAKATVTVGQPIDIAPYAEREGENGVLEEMTRRFLVEIARLAGVDDFQPQLAGKRWKPGADRAPVSANGD